MHKAGLSKSLAFFSLFSLSLIFTLFLLSNPLLFAAGQEESITFTTYYPSPYGSYRQLEVHRSVIYKPISDTDIQNNNLSDPQVGEMVYTDADKFYHYNGSSWVAQGGGTAVMYLSCSWRYDYREGAVGIGEATNWDCTPPSCPSGWTSAGISNEVQSVACSGTGDAGCTWVGTTRHDHAVAVGRSVRVCTK